MSSRTSPPVVDLVLQPSWVLTFFVTGVTIFALAAVYVSGMVIVAKALVLVLILAAGCYWVLDRGLRVMPFSIVRAVLMQDDECILVDRRGRSRTAILAGGLTFGGLLAVLHLREGSGRPRALCLPSGPIARDAHRRLRARIRVPAGPGNRYPHSIAKRLARIISGMAD